MRIVLIFLLLNFGALALGGLFTGSGVTSSWYAGLHKAPWTPPGWVFGAAWTTIMLCFSFYMAYLLPVVTDKKPLCCCMYCNGYLTWRGTPYSLRCTRHYGL